MGIAITFLLFSFALTIHEFAHGWIAWKLGDSTAKDAGRLTFNPLAHIDPIGTILLPIFLIMAGLPAIGWAKPVPVDFRNLNNPKKDMIWVGLAGPAANILFAIVLSFILKFFSLVGSPFLITVLSSIIIINLILAVFNIIPIPPLDGSRVTLGILPTRFAIQYAKIEPYGFFIIIALIWLGLIGKVLWPIVMYLARMLGVNI